MTAADRQPRIARRTLLGGLGLAPLALAGCSTPGGTGPSASAAEDVLRARGLDGLEGREIVDRLERLPLAERPADLMAMVHPAELVLTGSDKREVTRPLPEDRFYLSVAPFMETTHECHFHSLTTCLGELRDRDVTIRLTEQGSAEPLKDETVTTQPNGFLGLWLPRGPEYRLICQVDGARGEAIIATADEQDPTCLTTVQLT